MRSTKQHCAALLLATLLLPSMATAQTVFHLEVLRDGDPAQSGVAVLVRDDVLLSSFGLADQGEQWIVARPADGAQLVGEVIAQDKAADLALLRVNGIGGEPAMLAMEEAMPGRQVILRLPDGDKPGVVQDVREAPGKPARTQVRHTAALVEGEFAAPLMNNCGELLGISQSPRALLSRRLETTDDDLSAVGGLAAMKSFLEENDVAYQSAAEVCPSQTELLARAKQRETELLDEQAQSRQREEELSRQVKSGAEQLDDARQAEAQAKADAAEQTRAREKQRARTLYMIGGALLALLALVVLVVHQIKKRKSSQRTADDAISFEQAKAASATAELAKASAEHPDILLVGNDEAGSEHRLKINGNALIRAAAGQMIGRSAQEADYLLNLEHVSRRHCLVRIQDGRILVKDLGSANGTAINGVELTPQQEAAIADGDELRIGMLALRVVIVQE